MNYKEKFAGLNANEIIKKLEEEARPFNPLDFGFKKINKNEFLLKNKNKNMPNAFYVVKIIFEYKTMDIIIEDFIEKDAYYYVYNKLEVPLLNIPSANFIKELLENFGVKI